MKNKLEPGIYCIKNLINGKVYVGQGQYVARRLYEHKYHLERNSDKATALQRAVNKYGLDNFEFTALEMCPLDVINEREIFWIAELDSHNKNRGYNLSTGGESGLRGYKFPPEFGQMISKIKKAQHRVMSDEQKAKISLAQKGKKKPEGMGAKLSAAISGSNHWSWGKHPSEESRKKMGLSHTGINNPNFGKKMEGRSSQYYGVCKSISKRIYVYWASSISVSGKRFNLGTYKEEIDAAKAYDTYVRENNLPHPLNFPEG